MAQHAPPFVGMTQQPHFFYNMMQQSMASSGYQSMGVNHNAVDQNAEGRTCSSMSSSSSLSTISSTMTSPRGSVSPNCYRNYSESPSHSHCQNFNLNELSSVLSEMNNPGEYHGPTLDKKTERTFSSGNLSPCDLENKRLAGMRAMQSKLSPGSLRVPNNSWSGYGISHTSPGGFFVDKFRSREEEIWKPNTPRQNEAMNIPSTSSAAMMNTSNLLDHTPTNIWNRVNSNSNWSDLPSLLSTMKLDHYITLFKQHEIDLTVFSTLTDQDLVDIGINAFGARRRIMLAISELNKRNAPFSAAPGAERKSSSSSNSTCHGSPRQNW